MGPDDKPLASVELNRADAWLLAAITEGSHGGRPVSMREFMHDCDWLNRAIPTFDEVSFGIPRLVHAGYVVVDWQDGAVRAFRETEPATRLRRGIAADSLGGVLAAVASAVGAAPYPDPEPPEDRSRGRLPGMTEKDLESAVDAYAAWFDRWSKPLLLVGRAMAWLMRRRG